MGTVTNVSTSSSPHTGRTGASFFPQSLRHPRHTRYSARPLALFLLFIAGCCTDPVNQERFMCLSRMSEAEEIALGQEASPGFIAESGGVYPDPDLTRDLGQIVQTMAAHSHRPQLPWQFTILNTSEVNAFALPGGAVFVTRGLLARLESEAQFAHLMGHELGHVTHRHAVRGQNRALLAQLLMGAAAVLDQQLADDPDDLPLATTLTGLGGQLMMLRYSRNQELQSDERGVDYALLAGYDPREGKKTFTMFEEMRAAGGQQAGLLQELLSTHPLDSRRRDNIDAYVHEHHPEVPGGELLVSSTMWQRHHQRLLEAQSVYEQHDRALALIAEASEKQEPQRLDEAESILRACQRDLPRHAAFPLALGRIAMERRDEPSAARHLDQACALDPALFAARFARGVNHARAGRTAQARADLTAAHQLHPMSAHPCYRLARSFERSGEVAEAERWYQRTLQRAPRASALYGSVHQRLTAMRTAAR